MGSHSAPDWPEDLVWMQSPWGHLVHAFPDMSEVAAEAICQHTAPASRLTEPLPGAKRCLACLLIHGGDLADRHGDAGRWSAQ
jgi:hypothetical protein